MKKIFILLSFCAALGACGGRSGNDSNQDTVAATDLAASSRQTEADTNATDIGTNRGTGADPKGATVKGEGLIAKSDCLTCHNPDNKVVGPSYRDVAKKYEDNDTNVKYLVSKIIKGGSGVWGDVPMTPHPTISEDDAKEMVKYILSLN